MYNKDENIKKNDVDKIKPIMDQVESQKLIQQIPPEKWEKSVFIGNFIQVKCLHFIKRRFSYVFRCMVIGSSKKIPVYIKLYRNHNNIESSDLQIKIKQDFENTFYWYSQLRHSPRFHSVKPLFCIPELRLLVTQEVAGSTFGQLVNKNARFFPQKTKTDVLMQQVRRIGEFLRYWNAKHINDINRLDVDDFIQYMILRIDILSDDRKRRFPKQLKNELVDFLNKKTQELSKNDLLTVVSHGDFNPGNVLINEMDVTIIDIGKNKQESYLLDLTKMYNRIETLYSYKPYYNRKIIKQLQQHLLKGFCFYGNPLLFDLLQIRNTLTHLSNITRFHLFSTKENLYNYWVSRNEIHLIKKILNKYK